MLTIGIILCTCFAEDPWIKQPPTAKSGQCRASVAKVHLFDLSYAASLPVPYQLNQRESAGQTELLFLV